jgi:hypothetical protein
MSATSLVLLLAMSQFTPSKTGELHLTVTDSASLPVVASVELVSEANQVREHLETDQDGRLVVKRLPFGLYRIAVVHDGFAVSTGLIDIQTALPTDYHVALSVASLQTEVTVTPDHTLLDLHQTTAVQRIGAETFEQRMTALPGRSLPDLVNTQPGWLLEANGILHPRGSEYQTQYVVDGLPLTDNRSPAFAQEVDADEVHAMNILTGGYPAEYGRKLGGVIEVVTEGQAQPGFHGSVAGSLGSFSTRNGDAIAAFGSSRSTLSITVGAASTDRYLDPPVEENFTNHGTTSHVAARYERELTDSDRMGFIVRHGHSQFQVPNERVQEEAGQRQDRTSTESAGQFSYQRVFSASTLADLRGMVRELSAGLQSNVAATPIIAQQDRGLRDCT